MGSFKSYINFFVAQRYYQDISINYGMQSFIQSVNKHLLNTHYMPNTVFAMGVIKSSKVVSGIRSCPCVRVFWHEMLQLSSQQYREVDIIISSILLMKKLRLREVQFCARGLVWKTYPTNFILFLIHYAVFSLCMNFSY